MEIDRYAVVDGATMNNATGLDDSLHHRRVALQSAQDLIYLKHAAARAAQAKLDLHLPLAVSASSHNHLHAAAAATTTTSSSSSASTDAAAKQPNSDGAGNSSSTNNNNNGGTSTNVGGGEGIEADMRTAVAASVAAFIETTFTLAKPSISVAGLDAEQLDWEAEAGPEDYEAYDTALAEEIAGLHARIEGLNGELARTRRSVVKERVDAFIKTSNEQDTLLTALADASEANLAARSDTLLDEDLLGGEALLGGRTDQVQHTWAEALRKMKEVKDGLGATRRKAEEAANVVKYIESGASTTSTASALPPPRPRHVH